MRHDAGSPGLTAGMYCNCAALSGRVKPVNSPTVLTVQNDMAGIGIVNFKKMDFPSTSK